MFVCFVNFMVKRGDVREPSAVKFLMQSTQLEHNDPSIKPSSIAAGGHGGRVVTLSTPTSEAGVRSPHGLKWESW